MGFENYLEFVRKEDTGNEYPRIAVVGPGATQTVINYLELRPDGDYLRIANRNFPLRSLASEAGFEEIRINFAYDLTSIPEHVRRARFFVSISTEFNGVQRMEDLDINPEHILAFGRLERRLARFREGIIRGAA